MEFMNKTSQRRAGGALLLAAFALTGCEVTNPGPIQDEFLAEEAAQIGLINGTIRSIAADYGDATLDLAYMARALFPGGQTGAWGTDVAIHAGHIQADEGDEFDELHEARFISETAIARFTEAGASDSNLFQAWLWNGYAYRILGEWWCDTVLPSTDPTNTDPPQWLPNTTDPYFERAIASFTTALGFASTDDERNHALAGRAQANLWLGNYADAYADAAAITDEDFEVLVEQDDSETELYNYIYEGNSGTFRSYTVRFTWFEDHFLSTGDPRTPSTEDAEFPFGVGSLSGYGQVPYRPQTKYTARTDAFQIADYWEMQLLMAEAILRGAGGGDFNDAVDLINDVRTRTGVGLPAVTAASAEEAWAALVTERRIELWLEGRNAPDERRWTNNLPFAGADVQALANIPDWENPANGTQPVGPYTPHFANFPRGLEGRGPAELCFDIPENERERNENIPQFGR
jgi:tetratricopeptide (TPR) repeat protein